MWIMIMGPYTSGARNEQERSENLAVMNKIALEVFEKGHVPIIGVNNALPIIEVAGFDKFDEIMMPLSLAITERCDACLRIGGPSQGADEEMQKFRDRGLPAFANIDEVPDGTLRRT